VIDWLFDHELQTNNAKLVHDETYQKIRHEIPDLPSQMAIKARIDAMATVKTLKSLAINQAKEAAQAKKSITKKDKQGKLPTRKQLKKSVIKDITKPVKTKLSIRLDDRVFTMKEGGVRLTTMGDRIDCDLKWYPKAISAFEKYALCDPIVFERKDRVFLAMTFKTPEPTFVPNSCVGIDLGLKRLAVSSEGIIFQDKSLLRIKRKIRHDRAFLRKAMAVKKSKSAAKHMKKMSRRESKVTKHHIHTLCNSILASTKATTVVLEDLSSLKKSATGKSHSSRRSQVPFYTTKMFLTYKAQALGKRVETVNPAYTSKDDYRGLQRGVRKGCRYYASDGVVLDADHNAAINIAKRWTVQNELPISFTAPLRGRQTLWAGGSQSANRSDAPRHGSGSA